MRGGSGGPSQGVQGCGPQGGGRCNPGRRPRPRPRQQGDQQSPGQVSFILTTL